MSCITTYTGKNFDPLNVDESLLDIKDIAHALSLMCRGNGHVQHFYSVAQHSLACAKEAKIRGYEKEIILGCLLHDASEAYLSDVTRPIKKELTYYLEVEDILQNTIWKHFIDKNLTEEDKRVIFEIDDEMLSLELKELLNEEINDDYLKLKRKVDLSFVSFGQVEIEFIDFYKKIMM
ncbi:MAG: phosphohydrolase [Bacillota bacterium]|nr:phosphohydrolase [Bacillota bacterium]